MGPGVPAFPGGQQGAIGVPYPSALPDSRVTHSYHGGRTPGRGTFKTPFSHSPQSRLSSSQPPGITQPSWPSAATTELSAETSSAAAEGLTDLEALSLEDNVSGRQSSPILTGPGFSPLEVIFASASRVMHQT